MAITARNDPVTREQMAAFIIRAKGEFNPPTPGSQRFNDVPPQNVFYSFIDRLAVLQITLGCTPDHLMYCPSDPVKREQMAAFLLRGLGEFSPPTPASQRFSDVPSSNAFYSFIDRFGVEYHPGMHTRSFDVLSKRFGDASSDGGLSC